jgi:hypothetical protein
MFGEKRSAHISGVYPLFSLLCYIFLESVRVLLGHAIAQLVEALRYKSEGRGFDSQWCHWNFSLT